MKHKLFAIAAFAIVGGLALFWFANADHQSGRMVTNLSPAMTGTPTNSGTPTTVMTAAPVSSIVQPVTKLFQTVEHNWNQPTPEETFARFKDWTQRYLVAAPASRAGLVAEGIQLATARRVALKQIIQDDPERALELAVPSGVSKQLPAEVTALLEQSINGQGSLAVLGVLAEPGRESELPLNIRTATINGQEYQTFTYGDRLGVPTRNSIALNGIAVDDFFALSENALRILDTDEAAAALAAKADPICSVSAQPAVVNEQPVAAQLAGQNVFFCLPEHAQQANEKIVAADGGPPTPEGSGDPEPSAWTEGQKKLLIIRVDFPDVIGVNLTDIGCVNLINNLNAFYSEMSYGRASFASNGLGSDFTPVFRMPQPGAYYGTNDYYNQLRTDARNAAAAAGYTLANYNLDVICLGPVSGWGWAGLGYVGASGSWLRNSFGTGVAGHELGHNYGLNHANYWDTAGASTVGPGTSVEYGDSFDTMGSASAGNNHFNSRYKNYLNWLTASEVVTATSNGTYRVYCHDNPSSPGMRGLKVVKNSSTNYWVEFRQKFTSNKWIMNGAGLRWTQNSNQKSQLLDTTPGTSDGKTDSPLVIGRTFSDTASGIHITPVAKGGTSPESLDVVVNLGSFPGNNSPMLDITASATNVGPGVAVMFNATAVDADGDPVAYYWEFGEPSSYSFGSNNPVAMKSWTTAGDYLVRCVASDMKGGTATRWMIVRVGSPTTYRITGNINDGLNPVQGVRVYASSTRMGYTDNDGNYAIVGLPAAAYTVNASLLGFAFSPANFTNTVSVGPDQADKNFLAAPVSTAAPSITTQPVNQTVNPGTSATFSVAASGSTPMTYQWRFNSANISGATGSSYTKSNVQATNTGNYSVIVSNAYGTATSANAALTVNTPPVITAQPQPQTVIAGSSATFTVTATGSTPLAYQWRLQGTNIPGAASSSYTRINAQGADAGNYTVVVTNGLGAVTSSVATLVVNYSLTASASSGGSVSKSPNQSNYSPGSVVSLTASHPTFTFTGWSGGASGMNNPLNVTLNSNLTVTANFASPVPDLIVDNPQAVFTGTWATDTGAGDKYNSDYRTTGSVGGSATGTGTFTPNFATAGFYDVYIWTPTISRGATATPVLVSGNGTNISVTVNQSSGSGGWQLIASGLPFTAGTSGYVRISNNAGQGGNKDVVADAVRWAYSAYQSTTPPVITSQPTNMTVVAGTSASFSVNVGGTAPFSYQWRRNGGNVAGATNSTFGLPSAVIQNAGDYAVVIANSVGSTTSAVATLTVLTAPLIVAQPTNQVVVAGETVELMVAATGSGPLTYQWRHDDLNIPQATNNILTLTEIQANDSGGYSVVVGNIAGSVTSSVASVTVLLPPQLVSSPQPLRVKLGQLATFNVSAAGSSPITYQWRFNSQIIAGATSDSLSLTNVLPGDAGDYDVVVSNPAGSITSPSAELVVSVPPLLSSPQLVSGVMQFTLSGTAGDRYAVDASTNLFNWNALLNVTNVTGEVLVSDPDVTTQLMKFYRGRLEE